MGLLPLDPSRVGQMCKVGCCLVIGSCWESRVFLVVCGIFPPTTRTRFRARPPFADGGRAHPGLFASQRRGCAGQISEQRQRAAYLFDH